MLFHGESHSDNCARRRMVQSFLSVNVYCGVYVLGSSFVKGWGMKLFENAVGSRRFSRMCSAVSKSLRAERYIPRLPGRL